MGVLFKVWLFFFFGGWALMALSQRCSGLPDWPHFLLPWVAAGYASLMSAYIGFRQRERS